MRIATVLAAILLLILPTYATAGSVIVNDDSGTHPPNSSSPATFEDGEQFLIGTIITARITYNTVYQNGVIQALVNFTNGTALPDLPEPNGNIVEFTFGPNGPNILYGDVLQRSVRSRRLRSVRARGT